MLLDHFYGVFKINQTSLFRAIMSRGYEIVDGELVVMEEWMDMLLIEHSCPLSLG